MVREKAAFSSHNQRESPPEKSDGIELLDSIFSDDEAVGGVVLSNPIVFGVPDRSEIFRVAVLTNETVEELRTCPFTGAGKWLRVINPVQLQLPEFAATVPLDHEAVAVAETIDDVRMQSTLCDIALCRIRVLECKASDGGREVVFEGTEVTGQASDRTMRVFRVAIHTNGFAAHEVILETPYPG